MGVRRLRELHLFAGAGGGILGGMLIGHTPVCAVEIDPYCRKVLQARQDDGSLPPFPILEDVREFDGKPWRGKVDVVCGGFPCQPWSSAGKKLGTADPRHLWPEMARIIKEVRPTYVFTENVSLSAFEEPWRDLRGLGYRVPPAVCVSASDVGAPHLRKRWWLLAADDWHAEGQPETNKPSFCDGSRAQCLGNGAEWVSASDPIGGGGARPGKTWNPKSQSGRSLGIMAKLDKWPKKQMIATPTATANQLAPSMKKHPGCRELATQGGGRLNPTWVEWLMGWPLKWTALTDLKP